MVTYRVDSIPKLEAGNDAELGFEYSTGEGRMARRDLRV